MLDRDLWSDVELLLPSGWTMHHADPRHAASIEDMACQTLRAAPDRFVLIGFSMGGYVAREMARLAPDRVERLILIATSARPRPDRRATIDPTGFRGVTRTAIRNSLAPANKDDASLVDRIRRMSISLGQDVFARQMGFQYNGDGDHLGDIRCPTLIVAGSEDRLRTLEEAKELRDGICGSRLTVLPVGHMIPLEAPEELAAIIRSDLASASWFPPPK